MECIIPGCSNLGNKGRPCCKMCYTKLTQDLRKALVSDAHSLQVLKVGRGTLRKPFTKALWRAQACIRMGKSAYVQNSV